MRLRWPLLHVLVEAPLVRVRTALMVRVYEMRKVEYVALDVRLWRWKFEVALYDVERRRE